MSAINFFSHIDSKLWEDFSAETSFPQKRPLLAHYTSVATFEKIVSTSEFWFSNPLYMNDLEELRFGLNEGVVRFLRSEELAKACGSKARHKFLIESFQGFFSEFDANHALNTYVLCFSEHDPADNDGLLSMWRGYGGGGAGAAIVIDTSKLNNVPASLLVVGKVHYGSRSDRFTWIDKKISTLATEIEKHAKTNDDLFHAAWSWLNRLKHFALFSKHSGFHEEREWRVVYTSDRDRDRRLQPYFGHMATNRGIEPKLKLPIRPIEGLTAENLSLEKIVDRIILGPSVSSVLSTNSMKQMLRTLGHDQLSQRVVSSEIPYRPIAQ